MITALEVNKHRFSEALLRKVSQMDEVNQEAFLAEFMKRKKSRLLAFLLLTSIPSFHYFYLGKVWLNLIFWATVGGMGIWFFIDLFRIFSMVRAYNETVAIGVLKEVQILN